MSNLTVIEKPKSDTFLLSEIKRTVFVEDCVGTVYLFSPYKLMLTRVADGLRLPSASFTGKFKLLRLKSVEQTDSNTSNSIHFLISPTLTYAQHISIIDGIEYITCYSLHKEQILEFSQPSRPLISQKFNFEYMQ